METNTQTFISDAKQLNELADQWPDQDAAPALLRNAQIELTIRDLVRSMSATSIESLRNSTAVEIWNRATAHLTRP